MKHFQRKKDSVTFELSQCVYVEIYTRSKNEIENNSAWEGVFYQSEWVKINSSWVILVFSLYVYCC